MNQSMIVKPYLTKAASDLDDATSALGVIWTTADAETSISRLTNAAEALVRALASVSLAVERLSELVID